MPVSTDAEQAGSDMEPSPQSILDLGDVVLIVDDEPATRAIIADIFKSAGYLVHEACCAADALTLLERRPGVDGIFIDLDSPASPDGCSLAMAVEERWPLVALVLASDRACPARAIGPIGAAFIGKPYVPAEVVSRMVAALGAIADLQIR